MKFTEFFFSIVKSLWAWIGLFMDIIGGIIYANPSLGDKISFANVIHQYWWAWILVGTLLIIWGAWEVVKKIVKENKISEKSNDYEEYHVESGAVGKQEAEKIENYFGVNKKKEDKPFDSNSLDFKFHRRWRHSRFTVYDTKLNSLLDYIKNAIAILFLHYQESDFVSYETDLGNTKYWNPNIDNVIYHGVVFHGIKKIFEINPEGKKVRKEETKLDILFTIYVEQIETPDKKSIIDIVLDGDGLYAEYFFDEFQKYVGKRFRVSPVKRDE